MPLELLPRPDLANGGRHIVIGVDLGLANCAGVGVIDALELDEQRPQVWSTLVIKSGAVTDPGVRYARRRDTTPQAVMAAERAIDSADSMVDYRAHLRVLEEYHATRSVTAHNDAIEVRKTANLDQAVDAILRLAGLRPHLKVPPGSTITLAIGAADFSNSSCGYAGRICYAQLRDRLLRRCGQVGVDVVLVDEYFTSTACPVCGSHVEELDDTHRVKKCGTCLAYWNRDAMAGVNIARCARAHLQGRPRPLALTDPTHLPGSFEEWQQQQQQQQQHQQQQHQQVQL